MSTSQHDEHWLVRPSTIKRMWWAFSIILAALVLAQSVIYVKGYFGVDGWFGFGAAFGFLSCLAMVLLAKGLGFVLKRREGYYSDSRGVESQGADSQGIDLRGDELPGENLQHEDGVGDSNV